MTTDDTRPPQFTVSPRVQTGYLVLGGQPPNGASERAAAALLDAERARHAALVKAERECSGYYIGHDCGCTCHRAALDGEPSE